MLRQKHGSSSRNVARVLVRGHTRAGPRPLGGSRDALQVYFRWIAKISYLTYAYAAGGLRGGMHSPFKGCEPRRCCSRLPLPAVAVSPLPSSGPSHGALFPALTHASSSSTSRPCSGPKRVHAHRPDDGERRNRVWRRCVRRHVGRLAPRPGEPELHTGVASSRVRQPDGSAAHSRMHASTGGSNVHQSRCAPPAPAPPRFFGLLCAGRAACAACRAYFLSAALTAPAFLPTSSADQQRSVHCGQRGRAAGHHSGHTCARLCPALCAAQAQAAVRRAQGRSLPKGGTGGTALERHSRGPNDAHGNNRCERPLASLLPSIGNFTSHNTFPVTCVAPSSPRT